MKALKTVTEKQLINLACMSALRLWTEAQKESDEVPGAEGLHMRAERYWKQFKELDELYWELDQAECQENA
jgi:hypothetical protein